MIAKVVPFVRLPYFSPDKKKREISFFDYKIPKDLEKKIDFGQLVKIPFKNKIVFGLIIGLKKTSKKKKLKEIKEIVFEKKLITKEQFKLIKWLSSFYLSSLPTLLKTSLPKLIKKPNETSFIFEKEKLKIPKSFINDLKRIVDLFTKSKRKKFLLLWNDFIRKTAVYYMLIKKTLEKNKKVLILVPEIDQIQFFLKYLSNLTEKIAILHSKLKSSEIWSIWKKFLENEIDIVIGTRMSIFLPFKNFELIIIEDEENDLYKSKLFPYYDARTIAWKISKISKTKVIFSSSAPRVETFYYTFYQKKFFPIDIRRDLYGKIFLIDMKEEIRKGNFSPLSELFEELISKVIENNKTVILYLKRKGFSTFNFCFDCGKVFFCPRCNIPLRTHKENNLYWLTCYHCGYLEELPLKCPNCGGTEIKMKGIAIQKVKEYLEQNEIFKNKIKEGKIIITTSKIWESNDKNFIENIGLVGVVNADVILNQPDFLSFEKTFQELKKISNWSKIFKIPLVIQTWSKENYAIYNAIIDDLSEFYRQEISLRQEFLYPPFRKFFKLTIQEKNWKKLDKVAQEFEKKINLIRNKNIKIFPYYLPPRRKIVLEKSYLIKIKDTHPLSPLPNEVKKILPQNSFLEPIG